MEKGDRESLEKHEWWCARGKKDGTRTKDPDQ